MTDLGIEGLSATFSNEIMLENQKPGNPESEWGLANGPNANIEGFATDISVDQGSVIEFKIDTNSADYRIEIYRLGYYDGDGARRVATIEHQSASAISQPDPLYDSATRMTDAGNWSVTDQWQVPSDAVSGVYIAKLIRQDGTTGENHIPFIVRDDDGESDVVFQTSDTTWQAYNKWGGANLYTGTDGTRDTRAYAVSYNRPTPTDGGSSSATIFETEIAAIHWLEKNGYDVSYIAGVDTARSGSELLDHKVFLSVGHDEYWSAEQRANVEAARDAGVNMMFWSGNEIFWKTRWAESIDGSGTDFRTMISYKETHPWTLNSQLDPSPVWTGTWRDPTSPDGSQPENALTGTIFMVDAQDVIHPIAVPFSASQLRFWANTSIAGLQPGQVGFLQPVLGYEWDIAADNGFRPGGLVPLSSTTVFVERGLLGPYTQTSGTGVADADTTHNLVLYRAESGALVFGAGTVFWSWALDSDHSPYKGQPVPAADPDIQQAMVNLFAEMGVQPTTLQGNLIFATKSTDDAGPISTVTSADILSVFGRNSIRGMAVDEGGGMVAAVEVSVDGGATWHLARGTTEWAYSWVPTTSSNNFSVLSRAVDDSLNLGDSTAPKTLAEEDQFRLTEFGWDQGWRSKDYFRDLVDLNGDGRPDYIGFGASKTFVAYGGTWFDSSGDLDHGFGDFGSVINNYGTKQGFVAGFERGAADTGYGVGASIYAQGYRGINWSGATSLTSTTDDAGNPINALQYETSSHLYTAFGKNAGWSTSHGLDISFLSPEDDYASIVGFGYHGVVVGAEAFAPGANAGQSYIIPLAVGNRHGWDQRYDIRTIVDSNGDAIDLNGDGIVDFVGMGPQGTVFSLGAIDPAGTYTLGALELAHISSTGSAFGRDGGWNNSEYSRQIVHDPTTGYYDIIAFGYNGVYVAMGQDPASHGGEPFGQAYRAFTHFDKDEGWSSKTPRIVVDVNNDDVLDIVGFGASKTYTALGWINQDTGRLGFTMAPELTIDDLGYQQGWDVATTLREVIADYDGQGHSAFVASGARGTDVWDMMI